MNGKSHNPQKGPEIAPARDKQKLVEAPKKILTIDVLDSDPTKRYNENRMKVMTESVAGIAEIRQNLMAQNKDLPPYPGTGRKLG